MGHNSMLSLPQSFQNAICTLGNTENINLHLFNTMTLLLSDMLFYCLYVIVPNTSILKSNNILLHITNDLNK